MAREELKKQILEKLESNFFLDNDDLADWIIRTFIDGEWKDATKEMPPPGEFVLCYLESGDYMVAFWGERLKLWYGAGVTCFKTDVTHWRSLPVPPERKAK